MAESGPFDANKRHGVADPYKRQIFYHPGLSSRGLDRSLSDPEARFWQS